MYVSRGWGGGGQSSGDDSGAERATERMHLVPLNYTLYQSYNGNLRCVHLTY